MFLSESDLTKEDSKASLILVSSVISFFCSLIKYEFEIIELRIFENTGLKLVLSEDCIVIF